MSVEANNGRGQAEFDFGDLSLDITIGKAREAAERIERALADAPEPYRSIIADRLPALVEHFISKGRDYGVTYQDLGSKGQYAEMHRKIRKLRESVWDGRDLAHEDPSEITGDLFGNVFLMLATLADEKDR